MYNIIILYNMDRWKTHKTQKQKNQNRKQKKIKQPPNGNYEAPVLFNKNIYDCE